MAEVALDALAVMTIEAARLRQVEKDLHVVIEDLMGQLDAAHAHPDVQVQGEAGRAVATQRRGAGGATRSTGGCAAGTPGRRSARSSRC